MIRIFYSKPLNTVPLLPTLFIQCWVFWGPWKKRGPCYYKEACAWQPLKALNVVTIFWKLGSRCYPFKRVLSWRFGVWKSRFPLRLTHAFVCAGLLFLGEGIAQVCIPRMWGHGLLIPRVVVLSGSVRWDMWVELTNRSCLQSAGICFSLRPLEVESFHTLRWAQDAQ